jgi:hypothetical protein
LNIFRGYTNTTTHPFIPRIIPRQARDKRTGQAYGVGSSLVEYREGNLFIEGATPLTPLMINNE